MNNEVLRYIKYIHAATLNAVLCLVAQSWPTLCNPMDCSPPEASVHGASPGKNTGVGCHALFQGIFPNPGIKPRSPTFHQILYHLSNQGSLQQLYLFLIQ